MRHPVSVITNAAYLLAGLMVDGVYGLSLVALGIASGGFHAGLGRRWQAADECAMYVALCALAGLYGVPWPLALLAAAVFVVQHPVISSFTWVPVLVGVNAVLIALVDPLLALEVAAIAAVAFVIRQWAERHGGVTEDYGHGLWHILTAIALYMAAT